MNKSLQKSEGGGIKNYGVRDKTVSSAGGYRVVQLKKNFYLKQLKKKRDFFNKKIFYFVFRSKVCFCAKKFQT